jgi:hypothetical protein
MLGVPDDWSITPPGAPFKNRWRVQRAGFAHGKPALGPLRHPPPARPLLLPQLLPQSRLRTHIPPRARLGRRAGLTELGPDTQVSEVERSRGKKLPLMAPRSGP